MNYRVQILNVSTPVTGTNNRIVYNRPTFDTVTNNKVCICMCIYVRSYLFICKYICIYIYLYIYMYTTFDTVTNNRVW
jgi:hypothetical protein